MKTCPINGTALTEDNAICCTSLRPAFFEFIRKRHPALARDAWISQQALLDLRGDYVEASLQEEMGEITALERTVIESLRQNELLAQKPDEPDGGRTLGERLSDRLAAFGGSWRFIIWFGGFIGLWILVNAISGLHAPDPYPFILLNLVLSCLAALQAPVIMMSQNRQEDRDRRRAVQDYQVNLKAELEIRQLHEKLDHILHHHSARLLEIQQIQTDLLRQILHQPGAGAQTNK
ncbi:MAG TPA: DUF1003 domain-containing protein [Verrucomicrobiales bacterium]|jgi:uncharacterized membrane protein|nr:DUF1003 domain-containing protein [Verrucomicrobiales bacterium]